VVTYIHTFSPCSAYCFTQNIEVACSSETLRTWDIYAVTLIFILERQGIQYKQV
jgi:hypothetical protein